MDFDISSYLKQLSVSILPFFMAVTLHEVSHGYAAYLLGDDTAKRAGRLTLNPFAHIDIVGLLFLLITRLFGWAKPVPVDLSRLKYKKYGPAIVSFSGPLANFVLAFLSGLLLRSIVGIEVDKGSWEKFFLEPIGYMLLYSVQINIALGVFNLLPILPMDGGRILQSFLPYQMAYKYGQTERYGFFIILILLLTGVVGMIIYPVMNFFIKLFL
ncbi:MAG: site-2 protease family protein [Calditerrivibrio sp.]|nr:site-2 protease family protein [Calditerrivibrio sp.]MCA1932329.1 site-2 protease family protein [Calditerrivibrio sp.]